MRITILVLSICILATPVGASFFIKEYLPIDEEEAKRVMYDAMGLHLSKIDMSGVEKFKKKMLHENQVKVGYRTIIHHILPAKPFNKNICITKQLQVFEAGLFAPEKHRIQWHNFVELASIKPARAKDCSTVNSWAHLQIEHDALSKDQILSFTSTLINWLSEVTPQTLCGREDGSLTSDCMMALEDTLQNGFHRITFREEDVRKPGSDESTRQPTLTFTMSSGPLSYGYELNFFPTDGTVSLDEFTLSYYVV